MKEVSLFIDESGNMGTDGRYFLICALEIDFINQKSLSRRAKRIIHRTKTKYNIKPITELKGVNLSYSARIDLIGSILYNNIKVRYLVIDLKNTTMLLKKPDDKNACYNYLIFILVRDLIKSNPAIEKVNLYLDNRTVKIGNRLSLQPYLYNTLVLSKLETDKKVKRIEFNVNYLESDSCALIQWSDVISNSLFKKYNIGNTEFYDIIKPHIIYKNEFPSNLFGK